MKTDSRFKWTAVLVFTLALIITAVLASGAGGQPGEGTAKAYFVVNDIYPYEGDNITFDASGSSGIGPLNFTWDFGDGTSGKGMIVKHAYEVDGDYMVILTVEDSTGDTDNYAKQIYVSEEFTGAGGLIAMILGFYICVIGIYVLALLFLLAIWITNLVLLIKFYIGMGKLAEEAGGMPQDLSTFRMILLIVGLVGVFIFNFVLFTIVGQIVIYLIFKGKVDSQKALYKSGRGPVPQGTPPGAGYYPPYQQYQEPRQQGETPRKKKSGAKMTRPPDKKKGDKKKKNK